MNIQHTGPEPRRMCKKSVAQVSQWGLLEWTICENMEKTVKKVSEPFFSNKLPFFGDKWYLKLKSLIYFSSEKFIYKTFQSWPIRVGLPKQILEWGGLRGGQGSDGGDWRVIWQKK